MGNKGRNSKNMVRVRLKCKYCAFEQEISRRRSKRKKTGHIKHLYCCQCRDRTAHVELGSE